MRKSAADKLRKLGFRRDTWGAGHAFVKDNFRAPAHTIVGIVPTRFGRKKRRWYVGVLYMLDLTPAPLETLMGPFAKWKEAVACYTVTVGVK